MAGNGEDKLNSVAYYVNYRYFRLKLQTLKKIKRVNDFRYLDSFSQYI